MFSRELIIQSTYCGLCRLQILRTDNPVDSGSNPFPPVELIKEGNVRAVKNKCDSKK